MNLPQKLCPQGHSTGLLYDVEKMRDTIWDGSKKCSGGTEKVHAFVPNCI